MSVPQTFKHRFPFKYITNRNGRGSRSEFLWFNLITFCFFTFGLRVYTSLWVILAEFLFRRGWDEASVLNFSFVMLAIGILAMIIVNVAVLIRRLHDLNRSTRLAYPILIIIVLVGVLTPVGWFSYILLFGLGLIPGTSGQNSFGEEPRNTKTKAALTEPE